MDSELKAMGERWLVNWRFLKDIYFLMISDIRFMSLRNDGGIRYAKMSQHLWDSYHVRLSPRQLRFLVGKIRTIKSRK